MYFFYHKSNNYSTMEANYNIPNFKYIYYAFQSFY